MAGQYTPACESFSLRLDSTSKPVKVLIDLVYVSLERQRTDFLIETGFDSVGKYNLTAWVKEKCDNFFVVSIACSLRIVECLLLIICVVDFLCECLWLIIFVMDFQCECPWLIICVVDFL